VGQTGEARGGGEEGGRRKEKGDEIHLALLNLLATRQVDEVKFTPAKGHGSQYLACVDCPEPIFQHCMSQIKHETPTQGLRSVYFVAYFATLSPFLCERCRTTIVCALDEWSFIAVAANFLRVSPLRRSSTRPPLEVTAT
jgi:hypothetical protein